MHAVEPVFAENIISRRSGRPCQRLRFWVRVQHLDYHKAVRVHWCGEDGQWESLNADYHSRLGDGRELWLATAEFAGSLDRSLPGNVSYALGYEVHGRVYWNDRDGANFHVQADAGVRVERASRLANISYPAALGARQRYLQIRAAVHNSVKAERLHVHWSADGWRTRNRSPLRYDRDHWFRRHSSSARNPNQYGWSVWTGRIPVGKAFRLEYALACETDQTILWDNNYGANFTAGREPLRVLTLNLHCYQEEDQDRKLHLIARAIHEQRIDVICLQEVAEHWNNGHGDWESNAARIIRDRLPGGYHLHTDWSHLGFDRYREGLAILSRYPFRGQDSRHISPGQDPYDIHTRKAVAAQIEVPHLGLINVFSAHLSWWEDGFPQQFENLRNWVGDWHGGGAAASLVCGDFNIEPHSRGYGLVLDSREFDDQFLKAGDPVRFAQLSAQDREGWPANMAGDHRIDYIFLKRRSRLRVTSASVLFDGHRYDRVSDHPGYMATFEPD
jgi:maltose 6'-phosphate phosphatase